MSNAIDYRFQVIEYFKTDSGEIVSNLTEYYDNKKDAFEHAKYLANTKGNGQKIEVYDLMAHKANRNTWVIKNEL